MVDSVTGLRYAECSRAPDYINIGYLGRWGTHACPQCLPSDTVLIRSWTRTLRPPGIRHRHLPYHTIPYINIVQNNLQLPHRTSTMAAQWLQTFKVQSGHSKFSSGHWGHLCLHAERPVRKKKSKKKTRVERRGTSGAQSPHASVSGLVDNGSICCRDYARTNTSLACIHGMVWRYGRGL